MAAPKIKPRLTPRTELINARERLGLTRRQLAEAIGSSRPNIFRIEIGERHPSLALMQRWAAALGGVPMELFRAPPGVARARPSRRAAA
jgi:transcriptional regulator with XRE-family HTH domain